jgi:hypothetical protein
MRNKNISYETVTGYLKNCKPVLDNPNELTQTVMDRIERLSANGKKVRIMRITGVLSGIAATLLLCLLISETVRQPLAPVETLPSVTPFSAKIAVAHHDYSKDDAKVIIASVIRKNAENILKKEQMYVFLQKIK